MNIVLQQKKEITDSIIYAQRIQKAIFPPQDLITHNLNDYFILFKPRNIVSGDFYWLKKHENQLLVVAADCTGHGVPGAFMSMLGIASLNEIVSRTENLKPNQILNDLRFLIKLLLHQTGREHEQKDGMDIALCLLDFDKMILEFSGANNPLYMIRDHELIELKGDKMPIGIHIKDVEPFSNQTYDLQQNDIIYMFSDGYVDQFGGPDNKKYLSKNFKRILLENHKRPMFEQKEILDRAIESWKGQREQIDDIMVLGFRIVIPDNA